MITTKQPSDDQIEVEMALLACDQFHEAVLHEDR